MVSSPIQSPHEYCRHQIATFWPGGFRVAATVTTPQRYPASLASGPLMVRAVTASVTTACGQPSATAVASCRAFDAIRTASGGPAAVSVVTIRADGAGTRHTNTRRALPD